MLKQDPTEQGVVPDDPTPWVMLSTVPFDMGAAKAVVAKAAIKTANTSATNIFVLLMTNLPLKQYLFEQQISSSFLFNRFTAVPLIRCYRGEIQHHNYCPDRSKRGNKLKLGGQNKKAHQERDPKDEEIGPYRFLRYSRALLNN
jgi:hypothetical protein